MSPADRALVRKMHRAELQHLRDVVREQGERIEALERALQHAEWCADAWRDDALQTIEGAGAVPGLTMGGAIVACFPTPGCPPEPPFVLKISEGPNHGRT